MKYKLSQFTSALHINGGYWLYNSLRSIKGFADEEKYTAQIERLLAGELLPEEEISEELKPFCADEILNEAKLAFGMLNYKDTVDDTLRLIVVTTTACNFRCVYCYENHASSLTIDDAFQANLLNAIADYKERYGFKRLIIEWYGGEPLLLYERLLGFTKDLNRWCEQNEILYQYTATTNGYYLTGERYETLCSLGFIRFQVTVDGFRETHNKLRASLRQGEDTWSVIVGNLLDIKASAGKAHILLRANYNFELLSYLEAYLSFLYENFNSEKFQIFFYPIKRWGGEGDADIEILDDSLLLSALLGYIKSDDRRAFAKRVLYQPIEFVLPNLLCRRRALLFYQRQRRHSEMLSDPQSRKPICGNRLDCKGQIRLQRSVQFYVLHARLRTDA